MRAAFGRLFAQTAFRLVLVLWTFGYLLVELAATLQGRNAVGLMFLASVPLLATGVGQSLALNGLLDRFGDRPALKWLAVAAAVVGAGWIQTWIDLWWIRTLALTVFPVWQEFALNFSVQRIITVNLLYTWTFALCVALIWSARTSDIARLNEARAAAFEAAASRAEAAALRLQLNPHFLFNTLNGIASLVVRHKDHQAEEMIGRLADFLRSSLASDPSALIPLRQELETIRAYLHIEEARFGDRLRVAWTIDEDTLDAEVPNFLLQPAVENAIKHGVAPARRPVEMVVAARRDDDRLVLSVTNREPGGRTPVGERKPRVDHRQGLGLANTRQRLATVYGGAASLETRPADGGWRCEIRLPAAAATAREPEAAG
jgi:hypothetical protein